MNRLLKLSALASALLASAAAQATPFTRTTPTGFDVTGAGATEVGGVVVELIGLNNARLISQLAASTLFRGFYNTGVPVAFRGNPGTIGIQTGFDSLITGQLGGGIQQASFRITLFDGDNAAGDFDFNQNTFLVNNVNFGNWSVVNAQHTTPIGTAGTAGFSGGGFRNNRLDTGWFTSTSSSLLANLFTNLTSTERLLFQIHDNTPFDNFFDFTQGVDASLINIGQGPIVTPPVGPPPPVGQVPEPGALALLGIGLMGLAAMRRRKAA